MYLDNRMTGQRGYMSASQAPQTARRWDAMGRNGFGQNGDFLRLLLKYEIIYVYEGCGALRICRYLAAQNIRRKDGKMISVGIINRAIQNLIYIGVLQRGASKSEVLPALKIIDENVFARAQEIISARTVQHREVPLTTRGKSLLVGNVYCGCCKNGSQSPSTRSVR